MELQQGGGIFQVVALAEAAIILHLAQLFDRLLELARQARALDVDTGDDAVGVDDIKVDSRLLVGRVFGADLYISAGTTERPASIFLTGLWAAPPCAGYQVGFEQRDAVETPGGVDQFLDELGFGGVGGLVFVEELAAVGFVPVRVFGGQDDGGGGEAVPDGGERGALFTGFGTRAGGMLSIGAVDGDAVGAGRVALRAVDRAV